MLLDWIFFKPSRFKHYLWDADPELYRERGLTALEQSLHLPAYRNLLGMASFITLLLSLLLVGALSWIQGTEIRWGAWAFSVMVGMAMGVGAGARLGATRSVAWGVTFGVTFGVLFGMAMGTAGGAALSVTAGVLFGLAFATAFGTTAGVAAGVAAGMMFGLAFGVAMGLTMGVAVVAGALRLPFYLFQFWPALGWAIFPQGLSVRHPMMEDELAVLPFPGAERWLRALSARDIVQWRRAMREILRNPFQRGTVVGLLTQDWSRSIDPLSQFYPILARTELGEYIVEPIEQEDFQNYLSVQKVWLSQVGDVFLAETGWNNRIFTEPAWSFNQISRENLDPHIGPLARLLLVLVDEETIAASGVPQELLEETAHSISHLPYGYEVTLSLERLAKMIQVWDLEGMALFQQLGSELQELEAPLLRPQVIEAMRGLGHVALEVARHQQENSPAMQASALDPAIAMLHKLAEDVESLNLPERTLLKLTVKRWQRLVVERSRY